MSRLTKSRAREMLTYDPLSGELLWKKSSKPAGSNVRGYRQLQVDGETIYAHAVITIMMTGEPPKGRVKFHDGDRTNLRWANLKPRKPGELPPAPPKVGPLARGFLAFEALPPRIKAKTVVAGGNEQTAHWFWKGYMTERKPLTPYAPRDRRHKRDERRLIQARPQAMIQCTEVGYPVPGHRLTYSLLGQIPYKMVGEGFRCREDSCINPHHLLVRKRGRNRSERNQQLEIDRRAALLAMVKADPKINHHQLWERLIKVQPNPDLTKLSACDALGIPNMPDEMWAQYSAWCIENYNYPEDDEPYED